MRAHSATGQVTRSLGQKDSELRHERDCDEYELVSAEGLKASHVGKQDGALKPQDRSA